VILHGILSDSRTWSSQLNGLSDDLTAIAWDAPGCGRSSDPPETFLLSDYAGWAGSRPPEEVESRLRVGLQQSVLPPREVAEAFLPTLFSKGARIEVIEEMRTILTDFHPAGMRAMLHAFALADLRDVLKEIKIPTLLVYGDKDQRSPLHITTELHSSIPDSQLVRIHGTGHACNLEAPDIFNAEVRKFIHENQP
jgi:pimeloyl-ACP methyl ester carboxylesterase